MFMRKKNSLVPNVRKALGKNITESVMKRLVAIQFNVVFNGNVPPVPVHFFLLIHF